MNTFKYCGIAVFSLVTASAFAQMNSSDQMTAPAPMPPSSAQPMAPMAAPMNDRNMTSSGASGMESGRSGNDATGTVRSSADASTKGGYANGGTRMGYGGSYGIMGSQTNASDVHATPQPGGINNQMYRGN